MKILPGLRPDLIDMKLAKTEVTELVPQGCRDRYRRPGRQTSHVSKTDWIQGHWAEMPAGYFLRERASWKRRPLLHGLGFNPGPQDPQVEDEEEDDCGICPLTLQGANFQLERVWI